MESALCFGFSALGFLKMNISVNINDSRPCLHC